MGRLTEKEPAGTAIIQKSTYCFGFVTNSLAAFHLRHLERLKIGWYSGHLMMVFGQRSDAVETKRGKRRKGKRSQIADSV